jgi:hypothetical protein
MFVTMVVIAIEVSIISVEATTAIMMQTEKLLGGSRGIQGEADLMQEKFAALQGAFSEAVANATQAQDWPGPAFHHSRELRTTVR